MNLHLGCNEKRLPPPWVNIDGVATSATDRVLDVRYALDYEPHSIEWIYSSHMIEHVEFRAVIPVLRHWRELLMSGGKLTLATVDFDAVYGMSKNRGYPVSHWMSALFSDVEGLDRSPYYAHRCIFREDILRNCLGAAGYTDVRPWEISQYPDLDALNDDARSNRDISLLLEATA